MGDVALAGAILLLLALSVARLDQVAMQRLSGSVTVNDGDSLTLHGQRIRLRGIDAPEFDQECTRDGRSYACGERARRAMVEMTGARSVVCQGWERDRYGRLLARCEAGGRDVGKAMVEAGWAVSYGDYAGAEAEARGTRKGLWAGDFDAPQDWRRRRQAPEEARHDWMALTVNFLRQLLGIQRTEEPA
ncbi:thermonuclease family protein [Chelativorans sp. AA-79]|uniref:thermonuclease family protein n=1 Tax=Chelativorans sp. AA-79 TaxID=3028735 RepID=UPI0023F64925|nr:thermonuclease family protein [Chelativorans sp. AA-79]WEX07245.1 thermonuclease family protein [Chelativorans sp. AA-79]